MKQDQQCEHEQPVGTFYCCDCTHDTICRHCTMSDPCCCESWDEEIES